MFSNNWL